MVITASGGGIGSSFANTALTFSIPLVIDIYRNTVVPNWFGFDFPGTYSSNGVLFYDQAGWSIYNGVSQLSGGSESLNTWYVQSGALTPNKQAIEAINYANVVISGNGYFTNSQGHIYLGSNGGRGTIQWIRVRAYPPNGVMPSATYGNTASLSVV